MSIEKTDKQLMDMAILAGEIMLSSGAETHRVEDTMTHILKTSNKQSVDAFALMTGIVATINDDSMEQPITIVKNIKSRKINLNNIIKVNEISRAYCSGKMSAAEAYEQLKKVKSRLYSRVVYNLATTIVVIGFSIMFGGRGIDVVGAIAVGSILSLSIYLGKSTRMNTILMDIVCAMIVTMSAMCFQKFLLPDMNQDIVVISAMMPMVPGVAITNAIRDTLHGDYLSGGARILEAFLKAASIAIGAAVGMGFFHVLLGGVPL